MSVPERIDLLTEMIRDFQQTSTNGMTKLETGLREQISDLAAEKTASSTNESKKLEMQLQEEVSRLALEVTRQRDEINHLTKTVSELDQERWVLRAKVEKLVEDRGRVLDEFPGALADGWAFGDRLFARSDAYFIYNFSTKLKASMDVGDRLSQLEETMLELSTQSEEFLKLEKDMEEKMSKVAEELHKRDRIERLNRTVSKLGEDTYRLNARVEVFETRVLPISEFRARILDEFSGYTKGPKWLFSKSLNGTGTGQDTDREDIICILGASPKKVPHARYTVILLRKNLQGDYAALPRKPFTEVPTTLDYDTSTLRNDMGHDVLNDLRALRPEVLGSRQQVLDYTRRFEDHKKEVMKEIKDHRKEIDDLKLRLAPLATIRECVLDKESNFRHPRQESQLYLRHAAAHGGNVRGDAIVIEQDSEGGRKSAWKRCFQNLRFLAPWVLNQQPADFLGDESETRRTYDEIIAVHGVL
ncbi:hypothetical protein BJY04DRAFT_215640 [Aspergillus karnatakaensis]|uniref:uncharacterized protein n=1 Tax=Aspergillus karnatakaensis TaxID=1810916 RepID=UPI003CCDFDEB